MASPRIALVLPRLSRYGGVEDFSWRLAAALAEADYSVDFICARQETAAPPQVRPLALGRWGLARSLKTLCFSLAAERVQRINRYDCTIGLGTTRGQDILRVGGGPTEIFWRLSARAWPAGLPRAWKTLRRRLSAAGLVSRWVERAGLRQAKIVVCVSHKVANWVAEAHPWLDAQKLRVVYNRPDLARFRPPLPAARTAARTALGVAAEQVLVSTAGTNFALKGVGTLIEALALLPGHFRLAVAGGRGAGRYERRAASLGLAGRVAFLGRVESMEQVYAASDVFALPSFYDACSNAVLEALACGLQVVSSADNGSSYFLAPERVLADAADAPGLARRLVAAADATNGGPGPAFAWPLDLASGIEPYLELVAAFLAGEA